MLRAAHFCQIVLQCLHKPWEWPLPIGLFLVLSKEGKQLISCFSFIFYRNCRKRINSAAKSVGIMQLCGLQSLTGLRTLFKTCGISNTLNGSEVADDDMEEEFETDSKDDNDDYKLQLYEVFTVPLRTKRTSNARSWREGLNAHTRFAALDCVWTLRYNALNWTH